MTRPDTPPPAHTARRLRATRRVCPTNWIRLALYEEAFGHLEAALRKWRAFRADPDYDPLLDLVIVDWMTRLLPPAPARSHAELAAIRPREGRTEPVMVREPYRGLGLAPRRRTGRPQRFTCTRHRSRSAHD